MPVWTKNNPTWWSSQCSSGSNWVIWLSSMRTFSFLETLDCHCLFSDITAIFLGTVAKKKVFTYLLFLNFQRMYSVLEMKLFFKIHFQMKCSERKNCLPCNQFAFAGPIHEGTELLDEVIETLGSLVEELVHELTRLAEVRQLVEVAVVLGVRGGDHLSRRVVWVCDCLLEAVHLFYPIQDRARVKLYLLSHDRALSHRWPVWTNPQDEIIQS